MLATTNEGRRRSYVTMPGYRRGMRPANFGQKYPAEVLTSEEVGRLLAACSRRGNAGLRNRALIVVLWRSGLRIGEALALRSKDINLEAGTIAVLHGKGDRRNHLLPMEVISATQGREWSAHVGSSSEIPRRMSI